MSESDLTSQAGPQVDVVVLNFNGANDTISLCSDLDAQLGVSLRITVVDNCSSDDSFAVLSELLVSKNIAVIQSSHNGGYAYGNNFGLRYIGDDAYEYVAVINPDIRIRDRFLFSKLVEKFSVGEISGFISPASINDLGEINAYCAKKVPSYLHEVLSCMLIFSPWIAKKNSYNLNPRSNLDLEVEMLSGSFLFTKYCFFQNVGFFDEGTFLFCEERILAAKGRRIGFKNYLCCDITVEHAASSSIGSIYTTIDQVELLHDSLQYYIENYLSCGKMKALLIRPFLKFKVVQLHLAAMIKSLYLIRKVGRKNMIK